MGWKFLPAIAVLFASLFILACGTPTSTDDGATASEPTSEARASEPTAVAEPEPEAQPAAEAAEEEDTSGGKLVRLWADPPTLDPHLATDTTSGALVNEIFGGLVTLDLDLKAVPDLAETITTSEDGLVYTFHLRKNAKFHNGKAVTAQDVKWSLERAADPLTESPVAHTYLSDIVGVSEKLSGDASEISGVRVIDDHTIEITIDSPKAYFLLKMTYPTGFVLDSENVEGSGDDWLRAPNGTGPFKMVQYDIGEVIVFQRHNAYHLGPAHVYEIEFILSGGTPMLMYENDEIHLTGVSLSDIDRLLDPSEPLNAEIHRAPSSFSVSYIGMNVDEPPFDDPKFRQALNYAIDKGLIAEKALGNTVAPANGIIPPGFPSFDPDLRGYSYNPEKAKQLLAESRYGGNLDELPRITISLPGSLGADVPLDLEAILKSWEDILGVTIEIQQTEWATFLQDLHDKRFQMFKLGWVADYPDPENFLDILFHSQSENNHGNYSNSEVDLLLEEARSIRDQETRFRQYNQIEQLILDDAPWVPLWNSGAERYALIKPEVRDYHLTPMTIPKYRHVYLEEQ